MIEWLAQTREVNNLTLVILFIGINLFRDWLYWLRYRRGG